MARAPRKLNIVVDNGITDNRLVTINGRDGAFNFRTSIGGEVAKTRRVKKLDEAVEAITYAEYVHRPTGKVEISIYTSDDLPTVERAVDVLKALKLRACVAWYAEHAVVMVRHTEVDGDAVERFAARFMHEVLPGSAWKPITDDRFVDVGKPESFEVFDGGLVIDAVATMREWHASDKEQVKDDCSTDEPDDEQNEDDAFESMPIIENMLSTGTHGVLVGAPSAGKTTLAAHICYSIATGTHLFGQFRVKKSLCVLVDCEGNGEVDGHLKANLLTHGGDEKDLENVLVTDDAPDPLAPDEWCNRILAQANGEQIGLVVIDTLSAWATRSNMEIGENDNGAMARLLDRARYIGRRLKCATIAIHHPNKNDVKSIRGAGAILGSSAIALCLYVPDASRLDELNLLVLKKRSSGLAQGVEYGLVTKTVQIVPNEEITERRKKDAEWFGAQRMPAKPEGYNEVVARVNPNTHARAFMGALLPPFEEKRGAISGNAEKKDKKQDVLQDIVDFINERKETCAADLVAEGFASKPDTARNYLRELVSTKRIKLLTKTGSKKQCYGPI